VADFPQHTAKYCWFIILARSSNGEHFF